MNIAVNHTCHSLDVGSLEKTSTASLKVKKNYVTKNSQTSTLSILDEFAIAVNELISDCPQPEPELSPSVLAPSKPKPDPEIPEILDSLIPDTDFLLPEPIEENQQAEIKPETNKKKRLKKKLSNKKVCLFRIFRFLNN